jgi:hypothetical protein
VTRSRSSSAIALTRSNRGAVVEVVRHHSGRCRSGNAGLRPRSAQMANRRHPT